jgi:hypothetical protein
MPLAHAVWTMDVDEVNAGGIFAHFTGPGEDPFHTPVPAGKINILFRSDDIRNLEAGQSYQIDVTEIDPGGHPDVPAPQRFWVFIDDSSFPGIDGHDLAGPFKGPAQKDVAGQLIAKFRSHGVYHVLQAGRKYEITIS